MNQNETERINAFLKCFPKHYIQILDDKSAKGAEPHRESLPELVKAGNPYVFTINELEELNKKGAGIFFSPNQFSERRKKELCEGVNAWYMEIDGVSKEEQYKRLLKSPLNPSVIVESGNSYHAYWLAKDGTVENFEKIVRGLIKFFGADEACKDISRVLRIPGFYHNKREPFMVRIDLADYHILYTESEMMEAFPYEEEKKTCPIRDCGSYSSKEDPFWTIAGSLDNKRMLEKLSGDPIVNCEIFTFRNRPGGGEYIDVNGQPADAWLDERGMIGSGKRGGPTYIQWVGYYGRSKAEIAEWLKKNCHEFSDSIKKKPIDASKFKLISSEDLEAVLGLTIKRDSENKIATLLCQLSAYTENSQFNISFNAPSSTGKSYIPTEIARLFPKEDVIELGYCSPMAFYHDTGTYNKERSGYEIDLSRKILIFLDQPHMQLLERLRPLLSHDKKEIESKFTDKNQKSGLRAKKVFIKGFPAVIFCSAGLKIDEQEGTRFLLLSPETNQKKIKEAIHERIKKESDNEAYKNWLEENPERMLLKERLEAIRNEHIDDICIPNPDKIEEKFLENRAVLKPRHQRDIGRLIALIKTFALLNTWFRERRGNVIIANDKDFEEAFKIWDKISESQEYNLPPYIYNLYKDVIVTAWNEKNEDAEENQKVGVSRQEIAKKHYEVYGRIVADWLLRQQIIPMLETAGLIAQDKDPNDKRALLITPTLLLTISDEKRNSELD